MERIGIFGGTFNPPHVGHIRAASCAIEHLSLDRLIMIPTGISPHKTVSPGTTGQQRLEMLKRSAEGLKKTEISDLELCREGKSYTADTVAELRQRYPDDELVLLMGTDMFLSFDSWYHPERILKEVTLGVFFRENRSETEAVEIQKKKLEAMGAKIVLCQNPVTEISSTDLRRMIVFGCADSFLCPGVGDYIREHGLYGVNKDRRNLSIDELEEEVMSLLKDNRKAHVKGVRKMAAELAVRYGANVEDAERAGLLHDVTKAIDGPLQLTFCHEYGILLNKFSSENPKTLHALTGSYVAKRLFGENEAVVSAIRWHTTGRAEMTLLEKIVYLADYAEENRRFPGVEELRETILRDIDAGMRMGLEMTMAQLITQKREIAQASVEALEYYRSVCAAHSPL